MISAINVENRIEFISKRDTAEPHTVFVLRPLTGIDMMEFAEGKQVDILNMVVKSLVEVRNFPLNIKDNAEIVRALDINILGELINFINSINNLTGQDQKNS